MVFKVTYLYRPGGIYEAELDDPAAREAVKQALGEFKRRAVKSGKLGASETVLVGDVVDVKTQVCGQSTSLRSEFTGFLVIYSPGFRLLPPNC